MGGTLESHAKNAVLASLARALPATVFKGASFRCHEQDLPVQEGSNLGGGVAGSRQHCQDSCIATPGCEAFTWGRESRMCYLKSNFDQAAATWGVGSWRSEYDFCFRPGRRPHMCETG